MVWEPDLGPTQPVANTKCIRDQSKKLSSLFSSPGRCGDRLLAVDGHSLENIPHALAVSMLKQTSTRVVLEVVSWMGTEL